MGWPRKRAPTSTKRSQESVTKKRRVPPPAAGSRPRVRRRAPTSSRDRHGGVDERDLRSHDLADDAAEDRVVGAAEDERVDALAREGLEVEARGLARDGVVRPAFLGERDEERARGGDDGQGR